MKRIDDPREDFASSPSGANQTIHIPPLLQEAWIRRLRGDYGYFNWIYLQNALRPPAILIGDATERLGEWNGRNRSIRISGRHILDRPWESVLETLRHEMAHQYVEEVLRIPDALPHGGQFQEACRRLRVSGRSTAPRGGSGLLDASADDRDQALARIKRLLALAGSPNEHEAASAMRLAHKYLLKYNLDLAEVNAARRYETRCLGRPSPRIQEYEYTLGHILEEHFFVAVIWLISYDAPANRSVRVLKASGTPENLDIAAYVHAYVMNLVEPLWRERKLTAGAAGGTRLQYFAGLLRGFEEKLDREKRSLKEEQGLVWRGDPGLKAYYDHLHPRIRTVGGCGVARSGLYDAGVQDGRRITIRRGMEGGPANRGRLLPGPGG